MNPSFRIQTKPHCIEWFGYSLSFMVIRLWGKPSLGQSDGERQNEFKLVTEWYLDLNFLSKIGNSASKKNFSDLVYYTFSDNTLILELNDGIYCASDVQSKRHSSSESKEETKRSYTYNHIIKLSTLKDCIFDTKRSSEEVQHEIQATLNKRQDGLRMNRLISQHKHKLLEIEAKIIRQKKINCDLIKRMNSLRERIDHRKHELDESMIRCRSGLENLEDNDLILENNIKMRHAMFHALNKRRKELIADLFNIYPIEQFYIRGVGLPNTNHGRNDESIATALGFTAHLVSMLAFYLEIPLRYPTKPMGSRATIKDLISLISGSREFPLYMKGVDQYRYEFGVFLLNKNIEQLMNAYGLIVMDLRHTLPNIHYFIQAILTTSVNCSPSPMSVLSISSFANGGGPSLKHESAEQDSDHQDCHHLLTLQPKQTNAVVSSLSPSSSSSSLRTNTYPIKSSNRYSSTNLLNTPQPMTATSVLDAVTASSCYHIES
ncbi:hypothetical protein BCV71DRAFT_241075 [Rhizopus microsporus]|uniref:Uncharacterized protein n=1 Tax=Rhizopus microsporus TaxID=58291 RepID=A0A1X0SDQ0_RHIZD|nr:hypothetical protein BCV71DRAFT_241075 [Rhizopus microsporus]